MKKAKAKMKKTVYLGFSILKISKHQYMNFGVIIWSQINAKVSYMDTDNFINNIKTEDF